MAAQTHQPLSPHALTQFLEDGYVRLDHAFDAQTAAEGRAILWRDTGCDPDDPTTWTKPVIRLGQYGHPPFRMAANAPRLTAALDQLVGREWWQPRLALGTFPVRFPSTADPGDVGWHIDVSFGTDNPDFMEWRANVRSSGRVLLMLFLFSDVGEDDAPTLIRAGSHVSIAKRLAPAGDQGLTLRELAATGFAESAHCREVEATGEAGTVYLCHPFLVHSAQKHRGSRPRFMAQPPLIGSRELELQRADGDYSLVERAIVDALAA